MFKNYYFLTFVIIVLLTSSQGCIVVEPGMSVNYDQVKQRTRIQKDFYYMFPEERNTPFQALRQVFSKEIDENGNADYYLYDIVSLSSGSFSLKDEVYLLVDDTVFAIKPIEVQEEARHNVSEITSTIATSDSTSVSKVTGYQKDHWRDERFQYQLKESHIQAIKHAEIVKFRYYAGPHMITLILKTNRLEKFKEVIAAV